MVYFDNFLQEVFEEASLVGNRESVFSTKEVAIEPSECGFDRYIVRYFRQISHVANYTVDRCKLYIHVPYAVHRHYKGEHVILIIEYKNSVLIACMREGEQT